MPDGIFCKEYQQGEDKSSARCCSFTPPGLCSKPMRLRCIQWLVNHQNETSIEELLSHPEFGQIPVDLDVWGRYKRRIQIKAGEAMVWAKGLLRNLPGIYSFSQLFNCYQQCRRKWWLSYVKRVKTRQTPHYFVVGRAGHDILEHFCRGMPIEDAVKFANNHLSVDTGDANFHYRIAGIKAVCRAWATVHPDLRGNTEVHYEHPMLPLQGYCDLEEPMQDGSKTLWEHKFAASLEYKPIYRAQSQFYFGMEPAASRTVINVLKKPNMRSFKPKNGEGLDDYENRVLDSILKNTSKWFACHMVERDEATMLRFNEEVLQLVDELEGARQGGWLPGFFPRSYSACKVMSMECEYLPLCESGRVDPKIYKVDYKVQDRSKQAEPEAKTEVSNGA
jgi:hypothetical protein